LGVVHPLYPYPHAKPTELKVGESVSIGTNNPFVVQGPFGREMVFALLLKKPMDSLQGFWNRDDIGDPGNPDIQEQSSFLNALWEELTKSITVKGDWASRMWFLKSFNR
jgi:hypothetical protein